MHLKNVLILRYQLCHYNSADKIKGLPGRLGSAIGGLGSSTADGPTASSCSSNSSCSNSSNSLDNSSFK